LDVDDFELVARNSHDHAWAALGFAVIAKNESPDELTDTIR